MDEYNPRAPARGYALADGHYLANGGVELHRARGKSRKRRPLAGWAAAGVALCTVCAAVVGTSHAYGAGEPASQSPSPAISTEQTHAQLQHPDPSQASPRPPRQNAQTPFGVGHQSVCAAPTPGTASCNALLATNSSAIPLASSSPTAGYYPADIQSAYQLPSTTAGSGETIGIVDAYNDPTAASDLSTYRSEFDLPACTTSNGCLSIVNETGGSTLPPNDTTGWSQEISVDLDMASAICPNCHILLVEANSDSFFDLGTAVDEAASLGADVISNSYGGSESSSETTSLDPYYDHPGHIVTASSGDSGYGVEYPAASQYVSSVGGTTLSRTTSNPLGWTETIWDDAGSGCSAFEPKPSWQTDTGCSKRTVADVSADANPNTGVAVYDGYAYEGGSPTGWLVFGGTSVANIIVASVYALGGDTANLDYGSYPYSHTAWLNNVTTGGTNVESGEGTCSPSYLCTAGPGYNGPTGWGTPIGDVAFGGASAPPTVASVSPSSGPANGGTIVTVTGTNLYVGSSFAVDFGTSPATNVSVSSPTQLTATAPAGSVGTVNVTVTTPAGTSTTGAADDFTYTSSPSATTGSATNVTSSSATLNGRLNPDGEDTKYYFEYGTTTSYGTDTATTDAGSGTSSLAVSAPVSGLSADTTYYYQLVATNPSGTTFGSQGTFTTSGTTPTYASAVEATSGLVSFWRLGETSGTTAADSYGTNPGTYVNSPTQGEPGSIAGDPTTAVGFSGTNQYVDVPYSASLNPSQFSVEAWADVTGGSGWRTVVASRVNPNTGYGIYASPSNTWDFLIWDNDTLTALTGPAITAGWHYLVGTYNGSTASFYVDGVMASSVSTGFQPNITQALTIGMSDGGTDYPFEGLLDDVAVYNIAISSGTVQQHYSLGEGTGSVPSVTTGSASSITSSSTTLSGTVNPASQATSYYFKYGTTSSYGSEAPVPSGNAGSGSTAQSVSVNLSGLSADTTYYYQLVATNPSGTTFGSQGTFTTSGTTPTYASAVEATSGLVSFWRLGETSGTTAADSYGTNPGTYVNSPTQGEPGSIAGDPTTAVGFSGTNQYVDVPYSASLNPSQFSVEAWADVTGGSGWRTVVASRVNPNTGYGIYASPSNTWDFLIWDNDTLTALTGPAITAGWHYLVGTYNGSTASFYVDGVMASSVSTGFQPNTTQALTIGMSDGGTDYPFEGLLDDVAVYNIAISSGTVQQHYSLGEGTGSVPSVTTGSASSITSSSTTLSGTVNPASQATSYYFKYGTTSSYGSEAPVPSGNAGSGSTAQSVSVNLSGLSADTTYYYQLVATNPSGTTFGSQGTFTTSGTTPTYASAVEATSGLVSFWRLGETSGTTAADSYGTNPGTYVNSPTQGEPGSIAGDPTTAVGFSGTNQYVDVPYSASLNPSQFSVEAWADVTGGSGWRTVVASRVNPNTGYGIYASPSNTWDFLIWDNDTLTALTGPAITAGWHYLVGTYNGSTASFYVDGVMASSVSTGFQPNTTQALTIGMSDGGTDYPFEGLLDDVAVYNIAISSGTVQQHYSLGEGTGSVPSVTTGSASSITSSSTTLSGTVNPASQATSYYFKYGTTSSYGSEAPVPSGNAGSGSTAQSVSVNLSGLSADTTYYYQLVATNPSGTTFGSQGTFTTS